MVRRLAYMAFVIIVPIAVLLMAAVPVVTRSGWAKERLHEIITTELAQALDAQIRLGSIDGDVLTNFTITDFAISEGQSFETGTVLSFEKAIVELDLLRALRGDAPVVETIDEMRITGLRAKLSRGSDGELNIQPFLDLRKPATKPSKARFQGRIIVENAELELANAAPEPAMISGVGLRLINIDALAEFADPRWIDYTLHVEGAIAPFDLIDADGRYVPETKALSVHSSIAGVDVAVLADRFAPSPAFDVHSGVANAAGNVCWIPGELLDFSVVGHIQDVSASVAALKGERVRATANFAMTPAGIIIDELRATTFGADIAASGTVFDLSEPTLNVEAAVRNVDVDRLIALAPDLRSQLPEMSGIESVQLAAQITGPVTKPSIGVVAEFPDSIHVAYTLPRKDDEEASEPPTLFATASGVSVEAAIPDIETLDVSVRVEMDQIEVADVGAFLPEQEYLREVKLAPLRDVTANVIYSREAPATAGRIRLERIDTEHGPVENIAIGYGLIDRLARADISIGNALGAEIDAEGLVDFAGESPAVYAEFDAHSMDIARFAPIANQDIDVEGMVDASGVFVLDADQFEVAAHVSADGLAYDAVEFDYAVANVGVTPEKVDVRYLNAAGPLGLVAARGEYDFDGPIEAEVALAEVPVKQIYSLVQEMSPDLEDDPDGTPETAAEEKAPPEFGGTAYVYGFVEGELKNPHVTADLAVLEPGYNEWSAAAVTASLDATPADVRVDDVLIRRGSVVVSADATVTDIAWPPGSFFSEEDPLPEGTEAPPIDAKLYAKIRAAGFELTQIAEFIEIPETVRFMGLAELNVEAAGTVREPNATGTLIVSDARVAAVEQNVAAGPMTINASFEADTDTVILRELATDLGDGHIAVNGELTGISSEDDPYITAAFEVAGIPIDQYTPTEGVPSAVGGTIETFTGTVEGPLADPWPTVEAQLVVRELGLGRRTLGDVTFGTTYRDGAVAFSNIGLDIAGGRLDATSATYDPAERGLDVQIAAKQLDVRELLFWGGDLALQAGGENAEASRDRLYGLAHRVEGSISADAIVLEGTLDSVQGRLDALRTHGVSFDQQDIPDVGIACQFSGLHLAAPPSEEINGPDVVSIPMLPEGEEEPSTIDRLHVDGLSISSEIEGGVLTVQGDIHWDGDMDLLAEVNLIPLDYFSPWLPESLDLGGELALTVLAQGATHDPFIQASVEVFDPTVAGVVFDILQATRIEVKPDAIVMIGALLKRDEHEIEASGSLPFDRDSFAIDWDGPVAFQANMVDLPSTVLVDLGHEFSASTSGQDSEGSFWQKCETEGSITASLNVSGKLDAPEVRGGLYVEPGARFRLANWPEDMAIEDISVDAVFGKSPTDEGAMIEALDIRSRIDNTDIAMWGRIELSHLSPDELLENRIEEFTIKAQSDRQRMPGGTVAKNLNAEITAHTDPTGWHAVRVEEGRADLGKGKIRVGGTVLLDTLSLDELGHVPCNLTINLNRANLEFEPIINRSRADGQIVARKFASAGAPLPEWFLQDRLSTDRTDPAAPIRISTVAKGNPDQRGRIVATRTSIGFKPPDKKKARPETEEADLPPSLEKEKQYLGMPTSFPAPELDLALEIGHHVAIETPLIKGQLIPDRDAITLTGTPQEPDLRARIRIRRGSLRVLRGNMEIPDAGGEIRLKPMGLLPGSRPYQRELELIGRVWGRAEGTVSGTDTSGNSIGPIPVALEVSGALPDGIEITTSSTPPMSESEVYALLALGPIRPGEDSSTGRQMGIDEIVAQTIAKSIFSGVLRPLEEQLSEILDLEQFEVSVGVNQPVKLSVGKYIVEDLLVTYQRSAGGPEEEFDLRLSYDLAGKYQVSVHTDEESQGELGISRKFTF